MKSKKTWDEKAKQRSKTRLSYFAEHQKLYRQRHPEYVEKQKKYQALRGREIQTRLRGLVLDKLGRVCSRCSFSDVRALQIDHVFGGGCKEKKRLGVVAFYKKVICDTEGNYQILCANCNFIKLFKDNEYKKGGEKIYGSTS